MPTDHQVGELDRRLTRLEPLVRQRHLPLVVGAGPPGDLRAGVVYLDADSGRLYRDGAVLGRLVPPQPTYAQLTNG